MYISLQFVLEYVTQFNVFNVLGKDSKCIPKYTIPNFDSGCHGILFPVLTMELSERILIGGKDRSETP